jgi:hypothetical protein
MKKHILLLLLVASVCLPACRKETVDPDDTGCPALPQTSTLPRDDAWMTGITVSGTCLSLGVQYSGGCEEHELELIWDGNLDQSLPPQAVLLLHHDSKGDMCESIVSGTVQHDLGRLLAATNSEVLIRVLDPSGNSQSVTYNP